MGEIWNKEVTLFGVTMKFKYWVMGFIFLVIAILGFLIIVFYSPLEYDLIGLGIGIIGTMLTALTWMYGAGRRQVDEFRREFSKFGMEVIVELKKIREAIEETLKLLKEHK